MYLWLERGVKRRGGMECLSVEVSKSGGRNQSPVAIPGSESVITADTIILAIGQSSDLSDFPKEICLTQEGTIMADPITLETTRPGVFAGGDAVSGPCSVVEAIAEGKKAALSIDRYLKRENLREGQERQITEVPKPPSGGVTNIVWQSPPLLSVNQRSHNFNEIKIGFSEDTALDESQSCM
jgi:pyruvate/2-oxoglutarate dehydrogenase complex dihydrolipoamide dehydrogenase (E3) component